MSRVLPLRHLLALAAISLAAMPMRAQADLSLALSHTDAGQYDFFEVTATLTNDGPAAAGGLVVDLPRPDGVVYEGGNEAVASQGSFTTSGTREGQWRAGALASGATATLTIRYFLLAQSAPEQFGQLLASDAVDPDSSPGNGDPAAGPREDDEASTAAESGDGGDGGDGDGGDGDGGVAEVDLELDIRQPADPSRYAFFETAVTVRNTGSATATGVVVRVPRPEGVVYRGGGEAVASQGRFTTAGEERGRWRVGELAAGASATLTITYYLLAEDAPVGYAQVTALDQEDIDSAPGNGTPPSVNEDDEASTSEAGDDGGDGDPPLADVSLAIAQPEAPRRYAVYETVVTARNEGPAAATALVVEVPRPEGVVYEGGNEALASLGTFATSGSRRGQWRVGTLPAGATATLTVRNYLLAEVAPAGYAQVAAQTERDPDSTPGNGTPPTVAEDDEASTATDADGEDDGPSALPDLLVEELAVQGVEEGVLRATFTLANVGAADAPGDFAVQFVLSADATLDAGDLREGTVPTGNLAAGRRTAGVVGAADVSGLAAGVYFLFAVVDEAGAIAESDETNNVAGPIPFAIDGEDDGDVGDSDPCGALSYFAADTDLAAFQTLTGRRTQLTYPDEAGIARFEFDYVDYFDSSPSEILAFDAIQLNDGGIAFTLERGSGDALLAFASPVGEIVAAVDLPDLSGRSVAPHFIGRGPDGTFYINLFGPASFTQVGSSFQGKPIGIVAVGPDRRVRWAREFGSQGGADRPYGTVALSADGSRLFYSYLATESESYTRLRAVDAADGSVAWELRLADLDRRRDYFTTGTVGAARALPDGGVALTYDLADGNQYFARVTGAGEVAYVRAVDAPAAGSPRAYLTRTSPARADGSLVYAPNDLLDLSTGTGSSYIDASATGRLTVLAAEDSGLPNDADFSPLRFPADQSETILPSPDGGFVAVTPYENHEARRYALRYRADGTATAILLPKLPTRYFPGPVAAAADGSFVFASVTDAGVIDLFAVDPDGRIADCGYRPLSLPDIEVSLASETDLASETATVVVTVTNAGMASAFVDLEVPSPGGLAYASDDLPVASRGQFLYYLSYRPWNVGELEAGATATLTITYELDPRYRDLVQTAEVTSQSGGDRDSGVGFGDSRAEDDYAEIRIEPLPNPSDGARARAAVTPNPVAADRASVRVDFGAPVAPEANEVVVTDLIGRAVRRSAIPRDATSVDVYLDGLDPGIYLVVVPGSELAPARLIIE